MTADPSASAAGASRLPCEAPPVTAETAPFWDGCRRGELRLPRCPVCDVLVWYPRSHCPRCGGRTLRWETLSGTGTIYSFTRIARGAGAWSNVRDYVVAFVELTEGPRVLTNIELPNPVSVLSIGAPVTVYFDPVPDTDLALPRFRLAV